MKLMADFSNRAQNINTQFKRVLEKSKDETYGTSYTAKTFRHQSFREGKSQGGKKSKITVEMEKCKLKKKLIRKNNYMGSLTKDKADYVNNTIDLIGKYASENPHSVRDRELDNELNDSRFQRRRLRNYLSCSRFSRFSNGKVSLKKKRNLSTKNVNKTLTDGGVKNIRVKIPNDIRKSKFIGKALNHLEKKSKAKLYQICRSGKLEKQVSARKKSRRLDYEGKLNYSKFYEKKTGDQHEKSTLRISSLIGTNISTTSPHSMLSSKDRRGEISPNKESSTLSILKSIYKDASHKSYADDYLSNYIKKRCDTLKHRETVGGQILKSAQDARFKTLEKHKKDILTKRGEMLLKDSTRTSRYKKGPILGSTDLLKSYDTQASGMTKRSYNFMKNMIDDSSYRAEETDRFKKKIKKKNTMDCSRDKSKRKKRKMGSRKRKSIAGRSSHREHHFNNVHDIMDMLNCDEGLNSKRDDIRKRIKELKKVTKKNPFSSKMSSFNDNSVLEDFDVCKLLGIGSYSTVRLIVNKDTREKFALKIYNKMKNLDYIRKTNLENEIEFLKNHAHPNLIKLYQTFSGSRNIYLMLEYVGSLSLYDFIEQKKNSRIKEVQAIHIFGEMAKGIKYMHDCNFSHRDLKLDNIIIGKQRQVKLIDFGFCLESKPQEKVRLFCGTPSYMSPEILMKKPYDPKSGDIWSLGVCLYRCIAGRFPFTGSNKKKLYSNIKKGKYPKLKKISKNLRTLLDGMLEPNPEMRLTIDEILKNDWFNLEKQLKFYVQPRPGEK